MAIDCVRLLTDSAAQTWQRLSRYSSFESVPSSECFDEWLHTAAITSSLDPAETQLLRREYCRLCDLLAELTSLVHSRTAAVDLVRARIVKDEETQG